MGNILRIDFWACDEQSDAQGHMITVQNYLNLLLNAGMNNDYFKRSFLKSVGLRKNALAWWKLGMTEASTHYLL